MTDIIMWVRRMMWGGRLKVFLLLLAITLIWALELFAVQAMSFGFDYPVPMWKWIGTQAIRFSLDVAFCLGCVCLLPRRVVVGGFVVFLLFAQIAGYYEAVFGRALTLTTIQSQWAEGLAGARFDWAYVSKPVFFAMLVSLILKVWLLMGMRRNDAAQRTFGWVGGGAWAGYVLLVVFAMGWIDSPRKLRTFVAGDRLGMTYGFALLWMGEAVYLNQDDLLKEAVVQRGNTTDRLSAVEPLLKITGDVVIIQAESLDWRVLNHVVREKTVTPFLNRLADDAMLFKITACHVNGSCDADFVMLNAVLPSPAVMTYALARYPYNDTLPQIAARSGYLTEAFHGNSGRFFSRDRAFRRMGFDVLWFMEEMRDGQNLPISLWGVRDDAVLAFSNARLRELTGKPKLHYIITLTSHQPFTYLESAERTFLPEADTMLNRYFNSINFVDRQLEAYIEGLAEGTLVVVFGDHRAMVNYGDPSKDDGRVEYVPMFIHRVGENLAARQSSRSSSFAFSGELTLLDVASYIHRSWKQSNGESK